jgi:hypothetical protein
MQLAGANWVWAHLDNERITALHARRNGMESESIPNGPLAAKTVGVLVASEFRPRSC